MARFHVANGIHFANLRGLVSRELTETALRNIPCFCIEGFFQRLQAVYHSLNAIVVTLFSAVQRSNNQLGNARIRNRIVTLKFGYCLSSSWFNSGIQHAE